MVFDGCLLLSDIDGTLYHNGKIAEGNIEKIDYFRRNGGVFAIATGRNITGAVLVADECSKNAGGYLLCSGGGTLIDLGTGAKLFEESLGPEDKLLFEKVSAAFPDIGAEVQSGEKIYIVKMSESIRWHMEYESLNFAEKSVDEIRETKWTKCLFYDADTAKMKDIIDYVSTLSPIDGYFITTTVGDGKVILEFLPSKSKKSVGGQRLKRIVGARTLYAIGDYYNDIDMLLSADVSACVGGSPDEVVKSADYTVCRCENGAVAEFIDLIERLESSK